MTNEKRELNPEIDTTRFVNISEEPFDIFINSKVARHVEPGEEHVLALWVAQTGAKHLVDKILQKDYNVKDSFKDTPLRKSLFAQILPDMAQERDIVPLQGEDFEKEVRAALKKQDETIASIRGESQTKDSEIDKLKAEIEKLKALKKPGRAANKVTLPDAKDIKLEEEEK